MTMAMLRSHHDVRRGIVMIRFDRAGRSARAPGIAIDMDQYFSY